MHHVPEGTLRRLVDEPMAVPDRDAEHVRGCLRCQAHRDRVLADADAARELLARPQPFPDLDRARERLDAAPNAPARHVPTRPRLRRLAGPTGVMAGVGVLVAGVAAAATLTVVFSPTRVAPLPVSRSELQSLTKALGLGQSSFFGTGSVSKSTSGSGAPSGATLPRTWAYGTIDWVGRTSPVRTSSLQAAESAAGLTFSLPATLPAGVQGSPSFLAVEGSSVTVTFDAKAGPSLAGSTLTVTVGPGILAEYGGAAVATGALGEIPALVVGAMRRPTATSSGATTAQLEAFLLGRRGFPQDLAQEIRLLGNPRDVLPVPVPSGVTQTSTSVAGSPAVALSAARGSANAVVWEHRGVVRTVGGLLDEQDVRNVARQLG